VGADIRPGDAIVGLASSGLHSNGYTLARRVLVGEDTARLREHVAELGRTVGEELLEPTHIYVPAALEMMDAGLAIKSFAHITGDGFLNIARVPAEVGFVIEELPEPPPVFRLIQSRGRIPDHEMFLVYNMGIGFCVTLAEADAGRAVEIARKHGFAAQLLGHTVADPRRRVWIKPRRLVGEGKGFVSSV